MRYYEASIKMTPITNNPKNSKLQVLVGCEVECCVLLVGLSHGAVCQAVHLNMIEMAYDSVLICVS